MILRRVISVLILFVGNAGGGRRNKPCDVCEVIWIIYYLVGQNNHYYFVGGG